MTEILMPIPSPLDMGTRGEGENDATVIRGTNEDDTLIAGGGRQIICAYGGNDTIYAGGGPDRCFGGSGDDVVYTEGGPDTCYGGSGNDTLFGEGGPDRLFGGAGDDVVTGGAAADLLGGGGGSDRFVYTKPGDTSGDDGHGGMSAMIGSDDEPYQGEETIVDFKPNTDFLDFSALNGSFTFIGVVADDGDFTGARQVAVQENGKGCDVLVNLEGADTAEMLIHLLGVRAWKMDADDFLLL